MYEYVTINRYNYDNKLKNKINVPLKFNSCKI